MKKDFQKQEQDLIHRLQNGDSSVIGELYDLYGAALLGVARSIATHEAEAEDVVQEAFINIWKYGKRYNPKKGRLFTWLLNITRNKAIDRFRSKKQAPPIQSHTDNVGMEMSHPGGIDIKEDAIGLRELVEKLDGAQRELIEMAYFEGYTQQELSDKLKIPLGTVKTRLRSGIKELRKCFE